MMELVPLSLRVAQITPESHPDLVKDTWEAVNVASKKLREVKQRFEAAMLEWVQERGPIEIGDVRFYAGKETKVKCINKSAALDALLDVLEGDLGAVAEVLAADPFKPAAAKQALGERFAELFSELVTPDLLTGKPRKVLKQADTRFLKSAQANAAGATNAGGEANLNGGISSPAVLEGKP